MPSWFINALWTLAAGFILVVTGCFIAGMVSEARKIGEIRRGKSKPMTLGDTNESALELFSRGLMTMNELRDMMQVDGETLTAWQRENICQSATGNANVNVVGDNNVVTTFYADGEPYLTIPEPYGTEERK